MEDLGDEIEDAAEYAVDEGEEALETLEEKAREEIIEELEEDE